MVLLVGVFAGGVTMSIGMLVHEASVLVVIPYVSSGYRITLLIAVRCPGDPTRETVHSELSLLVHHARHLGHRDHAGERGGPGAESFPLTPPTVDTDGHRH